MLASISNFHNMQASQKMLILGDMRELGKDSPEEHQKIVDYLEECGFKDVALVGELLPKPVTPTPPTPTLRH